MTSFVTRGRGSVGSSNANSAENDITRLSNGKNGNVSSESTERYEMCERSVNIVQDTSMDESQPMMTPHMMSEGNKLVEMQPILNNNNSMEDFDAVVWYEKQWVLFITLAKVWC